MRFLVMTDIEGVTGVTSFPQAENSDFGRQMLMHDLHVVLRGIRQAGAEAVVYDMHTDGRNVALAEVDVPVVMGKPVLPHLYRGVGAEFDGLFLVGLHTMQHVPGALLGHSYLREYNAIYLNGILVGEIGVEAALAGEQGIPLKFVSGDDLGCREGETLIPGLVTCAVKTSLTEGCGRTVGELQGMGTMYRVRGVVYEKMFAYLDENPDRFFMQEFGVMSLENVKESYRRGDSMVFRLLIDHPTDPSAPRQKVQVYNLPKKDEAILLGWGCGTGSMSGLDAGELSAAQDRLLHGALRLTEVMRQYPGFENITVQYIPDVGVRETRHIVGVYTITGMDVVLGRDFEDSVACGGHPVDIHPLPPEVEHMDMNHWRFHIPYRVMVPAKVENLLVAGRPVSATRLASGAIRPTAQCMALGEAAGVAAAMCAAGEITPKQVNTAELRRKLLEKGAIL